MENLSQQKMSVFCILVFVWYSLLMINKNSEAHPSVAAKNLKTKQNQLRLQSNNDQYNEDEYDKQYSPHYSYHEEDEPQSGRFFSLIIHLFFIIFQNRLAQSIIWLDIMQT